MQDRRELWAVVDRQLVQLACSLRLGIDVRIIPAHEPEHGGHLPCCAEAPEVLAGGCGAGVLHPVRREIRPKSRCDPVARGLVIDIQRVLIERRDFRLAWRA